MNAPSRSPLLLTTDQFADMGRRNAFAKVGRVELRRGTVTLMSPVHLKHAAAFSALHLALRDAMVETNLGLRLTGEVSLALGPRFAPTADLVIWDASHVPADFDGPLPGAAVRLVIEVASASLGDDLGDKLAEYAEAGVPEYWVVDVMGRLIHRCTEPTGSGYRIREAVRFSEPCTALTLPLALPADALG